MYPPCSCPVRPCFSRGLGCQGQLQELQVWAMTRQQIGPLDRPAPCVNEGNRPKSTGHELSMVHATFSLGEASENMEHVCANSMET